MREDADIEARDKTYEMTPLHYAAFNGHGDVVKVTFKYLLTSFQLFVSQLLTRNGADINTGQIAGYTALHLAAANGHAKAVEVIKKPSNGKFVCSFRFLSKKGHRQKLQTSICGDLCILLHETASLKS